MSDETADGPSTDDGSFAWLLDAAHPVERFVLALGLAKGRRYEAVGTAFVIGDALALTARHIVTTAWRAFEGGEIPRDRDLRADWSLVAFMWLTPDVRATWNVTKIHPDPNSDLALLELAPVHALPTNYTWQRLRVDLAPPPEGAIVSAIGYPDATVAFEPDGRARIDGRAINSGGRVGELLPRGRGDRDMPHPCFLVYAQWDDNMSGAPVINEAGQVCGIVSRGSTTVPGVGPFAYPSMLWPLLVNRILPLQPISDVPAGPVLVRDLFAHGVISGVGWDEVVITADPQRAETLAVALPAHFVVGRESR